MKIKALIKKKFESKYISYLRNKFVFTGILFFIYAVFLDDHDIFSIISHKNKLNKIEVAKKGILSNYKKTKFTLDQLKYPSELERYAREEKYFKKENEDIFVVTYE
ncbi:MAG: hypothetical protein ACON4M_04770 [Crocinitomicaceae bacterium]